MELTVTANSRLNKPPLIVNAEKLCHMMDKSKMLTEVSRYRSKDGRLVIPVRYPTAGANVLADTENHDQ